MLADAADPTVDPVDDPGTGGFLEERRRSIQAHIGRAKRSLRTLHRDIATGANPATVERSRSESFELQRLITDWYGDYVAVSRVMEAGLPVDHLEVFEPPSVVAASARCRHGQHRPGGGYRLPAQSAARLHPRVPVAERSSRVAQFDDPRVHGRLSPP